MMLNPKPFMSLISTAKRATATSNYSMYMYSSVITDVDEETLQEVLHYIYTGKLAQN
jgi:hypothetical protein